MSLNPQSYHASHEHAGKTKHLFWRCESSTPKEYVPRLYFEAKIDYSDVRSGFHWTCGVSNEMDLTPFEGDLVWTSDMVHSVNPECVQAAPPEGLCLGALPGYVDEDFLSQAETKYLSYLLRHSEARVYRNFSLNNYSNPGETLDDFSARCLDALNDQFRSDLDDLREVINRRLERVEEKFLGREPPRNFEVVRHTIQARVKLHAATERIAELFLGTELTMAGEVPPPEPPDPTLPDLDDILKSLEVDVNREIQRLQSVYRDKVKNIDEYIIRPNLKDLHLVRTCILWRPPGAEAP